jgi:LuxR family maltose regulon positive regulatory protein
MRFNQLKRCCSAEEIKAIHSQAIAWFAENGLLEEALRHILAAGDIETAGGLVARFSHQLMNDQQWARFSTCSMVYPWLLIS